MSNGLAVEGGTRLARLLARADGYAVCSAAGRRLGGIIWLTYELEGLWPAGLRVQPPGRGEPALAGSWEIPLERVVAVLPERREVTVADSGPARRQQANHDRDPLAGDRVLSVPR